MTVQVFSEISRSVWSVCVHIAGEKDERLPLI